MLFARLVVLALAPLTLACAERPLEPRAPTPGAFHFKVQTFNVEFSDHDDPATVDAVGAAGADIVGLQETTPGWEAVIRARYGADYPHMIFHGKDENVSSGLAVLSRYPLTDLGLTHPPNNWHPAWHLLAETPAGTIELLNLHLRAPLNGRGSQLSSYLSVDADHVAEIKQFTAVCTGELPMLVLGDFNEGEEGPAIAYLADRGFLDLLPQFRPGQWTWSYRSIGGQFNGAYDHILADDAFAPLDAWVRREGNSDHLPVVAHLELSPKP